MAKRLDLGKKNFSSEFDSLIKSKNVNAILVRERVLAILEEVSSRGDIAVADYTRKFDGFDAKPEHFRVTPSEFAMARKIAPRDGISALEVASKRILDYHKLQFPDNQSFVDSEGVKLGVRWTPLSSVGIYVPGGTASYPSSVLMNVIPAKVAGVKRIVVAVPARRGKVDPLVLFAAELVGVSEVYKIGGAQAIGALAYGTQTIGAVDKIVGPGNAYVSAAKKHVFGQVGIDMLAGPTEILIVADAHNNPAWIAADLLAQAEHDEESRAILICEDKEFADCVEESIDVFLNSLERAEIARKSWNLNGAIIVAKNLKEIGPLIDRIAPEHIELAVADPHLLLSSFSHAGAIFLGRYTPEAIGDYIAGPSHVLPTSRTARFSSGLSVLDFMKRSSIICCSEGALSQIGPTAITLAKSEGLSAHALSVSIRLSSLKNKHYGPV